MVYGLGGRHFCQPDSEIWVNGRRIPWQLVSRNEGAVARNKTLGLPWWVVSVLASIRPEHIDEMSYHDCLDMSVGKLGSNRAIFVVLKPGIGYDPSRGSFAEASQAVEVAQGGRRAPTPRVLGVFDGETGQPLAGVEVVDALTGTTATTTATGTVVLTFLMADTIVRVQRAGYESVTVTIGIAAKDTVPITVVLAQKKR
jgi:hypothetical protein